MKKDNLSKNFKDWNLIDGDDDKKYFELLKKIREQIVSYLKVIYITVANEDDAYMIFETLNARGRNLSSVDLVKNELFKQLRTTHPDDKAKRKWKKIQENLSSRHNKINIETFFRHYWLSKYSFITESKIYKNFKIVSNQSDFNPLNFLKDIKLESEIYNKIANPQDTDWPSQDDKYVLSSLKALSLFNISQTRTFLLALLLQRDKNNVTHSDFYKFLQKMENFHFKYTAICSLKMNIFEGKYSKSARNLRNTSNSKEAKEVLNQLLEFYVEKQPDISLFQESFKKLKFTNTITKDKKIIQYIFKKIENHLRSTDEVIAGSISLEHILSQSTNDLNIGQIGNIIPLDKNLNSKAGGKPFTEKMRIYNDSELEIVKDFITKYNNLSDWKAENIVDRTIKLSILAYDTVWKVE